jgi:hypothetical protein
MSYEEAIQAASREERFMATVYAMNTLLISKGIYTQNEFRELFTEWVQKEESKKGEKGHSKALTARASFSEV